MGDVPMSITRPFLLDIDKDLNFCFVQASANSLGDANFITRRDLAFDPATERKIPMASHRAAAARRPAGYIFHTAFCGSTLLARGLHSPPDAVALKEPNILLELSLASMRWPRGAFAPYLETALAEITQPWTSTGHVIIKPTNSCNRIVTDICSQSRGDRFVFMYSTLEEFLVSCIKKMPQAQRQLNLMAHHLLPGSALEKACGIPRNTDFSIIEACVLVWYVSLEYFSRAIEILPSGSWMTVRYRDLKREPAQIASTVGRHCRLPEAIFAEQELNARLRDDSKSTGNTYDGLKYRQAYDAVYTGYGDAIKQGLNWAESYVSRNAQVAGIFELDPSI